MQVKQHVQYHVAKKFRIRRSEKPKYYGDIQYKHGAAANISTAAPIPASTSEDKVVPPEPDPSTADPAAAAAAAVKFGKGKRKYSRYWQVHNQTKN